MSESENFTHNVAVLRKKAGLSRREMAETLGVSVYCITKLEHGEIPPTLTLEIVFQIYEVFHVHPKEQFGLRLRE